MRWVIKYLVGANLVFALTTVLAAPISERILETEPSLTGDVMHRDPFQTGIEQAPDVNTMVIQGLIFHPSKTGMALLSGHMVWEEERVGKYKVTGIRPGEVVIEWGEDNRIAKKIPNYLKSTKRNTGGYTIDFRNAPLDKVIQMIGRLQGVNVLFPDVRGSVTVSFDDVSPTQALGSILKVHGYAMATEQAIIRVGKPDDFEEGFDLETETISLSYGSAEKLVESVGKILSQKGSVVADVRTNTLVIRDRPQVLAEVKSLLREIDNPDKKVRIEAKLLAVTKSFSRSIGIQWGGSVTSGNTNVTGVQDVGSSSNNNPLNVDLGAGNPTSGIGLVVGSITGNNLEAAITAAEEKGDVDILSRPTVTTLNNQPAKIRSGVKIYVKSTSDISLGTSSTSASGGSSNLEEIETGVKLTVTPQITGKNFLKLTIEVEESAADFSQTVDGIPAIRDNVASTQVLLESGSTTVIGGLFRTQKSRQKVGVPVLSHIPILGWFFSRTTKSTTDQELLILITPKILET